MMGQIQATLAFVVILLAKISHLYEDLFMIFRGGRFCKKENECSRNISEKDIVILDGLIVFLVNNF